MPWRREGRSPVVLGMIQKAKVLCKENPFSFWMPLAQRFDVIGTAKTQLADSYPKKFVGITQIHGEDRKTMKPGEQSHYNTPSYAVQIPWGEKDSSCITYLSSHTWWPGLGGQGYFAFSGGVAPALKLLALASGGSAPGAYRHCTNFQSSINRI